MYINTHVLEDCLERYQPSSSQECGTSMVWDRGMEVLAVCGKDSHTHFRFLISMWVTPGLGTGLATGVIMPVSLLGRSYLQAGGSLLLCLPLLQGLWGWGESPLS